MKDQESLESDISGTDSGLLHELKIKQLQLHWLLQITKAINYDLPAHQLFDIFQVVLKDHLKVGKAILFLKDTTWNKSFEYGCKIDIENMELEQLFSASNMENKNSPIKWFSDFETIIPVFHNDKPLAYALLGDLKITPISNPKEILPFIHTLTNIIVVAIENKRLTKNSIQQAAISKELELAAKMQSMLFPEHLPSNNLFDIAATYLPHHQVGGDYYDYIQLNQEEAILCMADISGKGISAALLMSNFQANLHALLKLKLSLPELINELNTLVNKSAKGEKFITFFIAHINNHSQTIKYINAGHNPPLLMTGKKFSLLEAGTTGLGMFDELPFIHEGKSAFPNGSILFCYTDGITDIEDYQGNLFGLEKIQDILLDNHEVYTMTDLHLIFMDAFHKFKGPNGFPDDITMLSYKSNQ